jgi:small subunit ribosomal protein S16
MVKIRMKRIGATKRPKYRIVVQDSRTRRDGAVIEEIGFYDPQSNPVDLRIDVEKATKWLTNGAQPTETTVSLLRRAGVEHAAVAANTPKKA